MDGGGGGILGTLTVRHSPTSASQVRRCLAEDLSRAGLAGDVVADAALLASELVGNSVRYARPLPGGLLRIDWGFDGGRLVLRVTDGGSGNAPHREEAGPLDTRGRGLAIVDALAQDWGVERGRDGSTVWAQLPAAVNPGLQLPAAGYPRPVRSPRRPTVRPPYPTVDGSR